MNRLIWLVLIAVSLPIALAGCGGAQPSVHYYRLDPLALTAPPDTAKGDELRIGVGPVTIPESLKRQEIVSHMRDNQLQVSTLHRWAGLLEKDLTRVITENLGRQLGSDQVLSFPWASYFKPDYRVVIDILEMSGDLEHVVTLRAGWTIVDGTGKEILLRKISSYRQPAAEQSMNGLVGATNQTIALLCEEIGTALRSRAKM